MAITGRDLEKGVEALASVMGVGTEYGTIGNLQLSSYAPGRQRLYAVEQLVNERGGVRRLSGHYSMPGKELDRWLEGAIWALDWQQQQQGGER